MAFILFSLTAWTPHLAADDVFHYFEADERPVPRLSGSRLVGLVPFENMTGDSDVDWVGEAMTSALSEAIEKGGGGVRIVGREMLEEERNGRRHKIDLAEMVKRMVKSLGINTIIRCEYGRSTRGLFRFACRLREPGAGSEWYAVSEYGTLGEIFEVQGRLSESVCDALGLELGGERPPQKVGIKPYEYYQKALSSPEGSYRRVHYCLKALEEDPGYVRARFCLAEAYYLIGISYGHGDCLDRALREYRNVIAADPLHSRAHYRMGMVSFLKGDYGGSRSAFERALELSPGMPEARVGLRRLAEVSR